MIFLANMKKLKLVRTYNGLPALTQKRPNLRWHGEQQVLIPPGQHGAAKVYGQLKQRGRRSRYANRLSAKQKIRHNYALRERQFVKYIHQLQNFTLNELIKTIESRLDRFVSRLDSSTILSGRQRVTHRHVLVNGKVVNLPSFHLQNGDIVRLRGTQKSMEFRSAQLLTWLQKDGTSFVERELPRRQDTRRASKQVSRPWKRAPGSGSSSTSTRLGLTYYSDGSGDGGASTDSTPVIQDRPGGSPAAIRRVQWFYYKRAHDHWRGMIFQFQCPQNYQVTVVQSPVTLPRVKNSDPERDLVSHPQVRVEQRFRQNQQKRKTMRDDKRIRRRNRRPYKFAFRLQQRRVVEYYTS
jgi:small subunit ribosomal protein S4